ncbi:NAD(P)-binding protein [Rhodotorula sp. JG-1b]|nr:NAD(P)-binding protein [Rhodotorula sp. JG-1b]
MTSHTCRWGILSTGWIANKFTLDLLVDPCTRQVSDVRHEVVAIGSRSKESAQRFLDATWKEAGVSTGKENVKLYASYGELFRDESIDCVYVGTPHSHHYANVHAALSAGKNVLCEKSLVVNAKQAQALIDLARSKNLFLMEAVWTRFQPYAYKLHEVLDSGAIGQIRAVQAELCVDFGPTAAKNPEHRLVNPYLAGGALLDLGPYPWTQLALTLLPRPPKASNEPCEVPKVAAGMTKTPSGVDASVVASIGFKQEDGRIVHGTLTTAQDRQTTPSRCVLVQGQKGYIEVAFPTYRPRKFTVYRYESEEQFADLEAEPHTEEFSFEPRPGGIWGFAWEADEVARCLRDGKKESDRMPLRESLLMMQVFDQIREQGEFVYPEELETLELK